VRSGKKMQSSKLRAYPAYRTGRRQAGKIQNDSKHSVLGLSNNAATQWLPKFCVFRLGKPEARRVNFKF